MADCFFCGAFVGEENGDGGVKGRTVGNKDICEQCLGELKHWLNAALPRAPSMRENKIEEKEETDYEVEENELEQDSEKKNEEIGEENPFSSGAKI
jgi:hypothetical protein